MKVIHLLYQLQLFEENKLNITRTLQTIFIVFISMISFNIRAHSGSQHHIHWPHDIVYFTYVSVFFALIFAIFMSYKNIKEYKSNYLKELKIQENLGSQS